MIYFLVLEYGKGTGNGSPAALERELFQRVVEEEPEDRYFLLRA